MYFGKSDYTYKFGENFNDESKYVFSSYLLSISRFDCKYVRDSSELSRDT